MGDVDVDGGVDGSGGDCWIGMLLGRWSAWGRGWKRWGKLERLKWDPWTRMGPLSLSLGRLFLTDAWTDVYSGTFIDYLAHISGFFLKKKKRGRQGEETDHI